jgi:hypothetical protein
MLVLVLVPLMVMVVVNSLMESLAVRLGMEPTYAHRGWN